MSEQHTSQPRAGDEAGAPAPRHDRAPALSPEVEAEIEAAMNDLHNAGAMDKPGGAAPAPIRGPRVIVADREYRSGLVVSVGPTDVFLEFGPKELGVVPRLQWTDPEKLPKPGDRVDVAIDKYERDEGLYFCSLPGAVRKADWEALEPGQVIEARVTGVNKGGLELEVAHHRAFMPAGQVALEHIPDLSVFVGEKLKCKVARVDRGGRGNIVLSRREILDEERREHADRLRATLSEGQVVEGTVRKIMPFGAFVDIGGVDGLVHVSDLSHDRVGHGEKAIEKHVKVGERVRVQVLKLDWEAKRISLGIKQTQADPFQQADISEGSEVTGRVTSITEFGAFVEISPGIEGLIHISELAHRRVGSVGEVVKKDQVVKVRVLRVDPDSRRISLSMKALETPPAREPRRGDGPRGPTAEEILKEDPALRRLRAKFGGKSLKGGLGI